MKKVFDFFCGRKMFLALLSVVVSTVLLCVGMLEDGYFVTIFLATIGSYFTSNVVQKARSVPGAEKHGDN